MKICYDLSECLSEYFIKDFLFKDNINDSLFVILKAGLPITQEELFKNINIKDFSVKVQMIEGCTQILHFFRKTNFVEFSTKSATSKHSCDSFFVKVSLFLICTRLMI